MPTARRPRYDPIHTALPAMLQAALARRHQQLQALLDPLVPKLEGLGLHAQRTLSQVREQLAASEQAQGALPTPMTVGRTTDGAYPMREARHGLDQVALPIEVRQAIEALVHEQQQAERLAEFDLAPRHRILLHGAPGNGKTMLAEALAHALGLPFVSVNYASLISSFMGTTSKAVEGLFQSVALAPVVVFIDELDSVGARRGDPMEVGEMRRVLNHLMLQMDRLPEHCILVGATNLVEHLDPALRRRFELTLELPAPTADTIRACAERELDPAKTAGHDLRSHIGTIVARKPANLSEVVNLCRALRRDVALHGGKHLEALLAAPAI